MKPKPVLINTSFFQPVAILLLAMALNVYADKPQKTRPETPPNAKKCQSSPAEKSSSQSIPAPGAPASPTVKDATAQLPATNSTPVNPTAHTGAGKVIHDGPAANGSTAPISAEIGLLRQAYGLLATADQDYKGHRALAMRNISAAGRILGINLGGDGRGGESQGVSDAQLRAASVRLERCLAIACANDQKEVAGHTRAAIHHISIALHIR